MRASVYDQYSKNFDDLEVREIDEPKVSPASVLIEVKAAGVNPVDWKVMSGGLDPIMPVQFPVIPGWDVAGVVIAVGLDTPEFAVGDEVIAYARKDVVGAGSYAERMAVPVRSVARKPANLSWEQAAGLPLAGGTALRSLDMLSETPGFDGLKDATILIHGAAGGVGSAAVQIAVAAGARVIGSASESNHDYLRSLGAEPVTYGDGLIARVRALVGTGPSASAEGNVDGVVDYVGGQLETTLAVLRPGGAHASVADPSVTDHGGHLVWVRPEGSETARLTELAEAGKLTVEVAGTYGLQQVPEAFRASATGHTRGKLVIVP